MIMNNITTMENLQVKTMFHLLNEIIDAQLLNEIIQEEQKSFLAEMNPSRKNAYKTRIKDARELNKKYLSILN